MHSFHVELDSKDGNNRTKKRVICTINGQEEFHCALMRKKAGGFYIYIGKPLLKKLNLSAGDSFEYSLKEDDTQYQFQYPEELKEVLDTDPTAKAIFESLTDGNKRGLMHLVNKLKSMDKRIERSLTIAEKLKLGITSPRLIMKK